MEPEARDNWQDDETFLLDYWGVIQKRGRMIILLVFCITFVVGFHTYFIATRIYESKAAILAPRETAGSGAGIAAAFASPGISQLLGGLGGLISAGGTSRDTFVAILKSRTVAEEIVSRFNLKQYYKKRFTQDAVNTLQDVTDIKTSKEGVITVTVEDKDPRLAADIANAYITSLDRLFTKLGTTDASRQRAFVADRLEKTEKTLRQAEENLRRFQEKNKAVVISEQMKSAIEEAAKQRGNIAAAEVQLEVMRSFATESNPEVLQQKRKIEELKRQLGQLEYGKGLQLSSGSLKADGEAQDFHLPFTKAPELGMELARLLREVRVQETVFGLLTAQYEQEKISEAKDTPTVQVLDKATPAERPSKPTTRVNMAIAGAISLLLGTFLAFFLEYLERIRRLRSKIA